MFEHTKEVVMVFIASVIGFFFTMLKRSVTKRDEAMDSLLNRVRVLEAKPIHTREEIDAKLESHKEEFLRIMEMNQKFNEHRLNDLKEGILRIESLIVGKHGKDS